MNFDDLTKVWHSPINQPSPAQLEKDKMKFIADLRKRNRSFFLWMGTTIVLLTTLLVTAFVRIWIKDVPFDLHREWSVIPWAVLPLVTVIVFWNQYRLHCKQHRDYAQSITASLRALLDQNRLARLRVSFTAGLNLLMILALPLVVTQIQAVGKAGREIEAMYVIFPAIFGVILIFLAFERRTLLRKRGELESLLASYEAGIEESVK